MAEDRERLLAEESVHQRRQPRARQPMLQQPAEQVVVPQKLVAQLGGAAPRPAGDPAVEARRACGPWRGRGRSAAMPLAACWSGRGRRGSRELHVWKAAVPLGPAVAPAAAHQPADQLDVAFANMMQPRTAPRLSSSIPGTAAAVAAVAVLAVALRTERTATAGWPPRRPHRRTAGPKRPAFLRPSPRSGLRVPLGHSRRVEERRSASPPGLGITWRDDSHGLATVTSRRYQPSRKRTIPSKASASSSFVARSPERLRERLVSQHARPAACSSRSSSVSALAAPAPPGAGQMGIGRREPALASLVDVMCRIFFSSGRPGRVCIYLCMCTD